MAERRYTTEQLESAETIMKMLAAVPKEKRAELLYIHRSGNRRNHRRADQQGTEPQRGHGQDGRR